MVHEHDGDVEGALQLAQVGEQRRDLARQVLVDAVKPDERVEHEQARTEPGDGRGQRGAITLDVEADRGRGDHLDIEVGEVVARGASDAGEPLPHDVERILGSEQQHAAGADHREPAQARRARGDRDGEIEHEERLAALGLAANDANGLVPPEVLDEPTPRDRHVGEVGGAADRQAGRRRHRRAGFARAAVAGVRVGRWSAGRGGMAGHAGRGRPGGSRAGRTERCRGRAGERARDRE